MPCSNDQCTTRKDQHSRSSKAESLQNLGCNLRLNCTALWAKSSLDSVWTIISSLMWEVRQKNRFLITPNILIEHWAIGALQLRANHKVMAFSLLTWWKKLYKTGTPKLSLLQCEDIKFHDSEDPETLEDLSFNFKIATDVIMGC